MKLTLLLDLDDTLLDNDIDSFLPSYLQTFSAEVADFVPPDQFVSALLRGTRAMVNNRRPDCTLQEVFEDYFFQALQIDKAGFEELAKKYYSERFPELRTLTSRRPGAEQLVQEAVERGYRLAVATNPLFPMAAIEERLRWAGLDPQEYPFELVTSYESSHFAKPDPAYFAEALARLGWPAGPVLMVGDDYDRDIVGANKLGLPTYWVTPNQQPGTEGNRRASMSGGLEDILSWLDSTSPEELQPDYSNPDAMLAILRATPAVLEYACRNLPEAWWTAQHVHGEWCLTEILCHLRDVEAEVNQARLDLVMGQDNPFLPGQDTDPWAIERNYITQDGAKAMHQFLVARLKLLGKLEAIDADGWQRPARHSIFGRTTLAELVGIIAGHDRLHLQQLHQLMKLFAS